MPTENKINSRQKQAILRKKAILKAAFDQFTQKGFAMTRMDDIACQAQVSKGSIYNHFASKEALLEELVKEHIVAVIPQKLPDQNDTRTLPDFIYAVLLRIMKNACYGDAGKLLHLVISEGERFPNIAAMYYSTVITMALEKVHMFLQQAADENLLAKPELKNSPQLLIAPVLQAMIWAKLFSKFQQMDFEQMLKLQLDLIFTQPAREVKTNEK